MKTDLLGPDSTISISVLGWNSPTNCEALPKRSQNPRDPFCHLDPNRQKRKGRDRTISLSTPSSQACSSSPHILAISLLSWKRRTCIREEDAENNKRMPVQCGTLGRFFSARRSGKEISSAREVPPRPPALFPATTQLQSP